MKQHSLLNSEFKSNIYSITVVRDVTDLHGKNLRLMQLFHLNILQYSVSINFFNSKISKMVGIEVKL
jgi:hypothetical protein